MKKMVYLATIIFGYFFIYTNHNLLAFNQKKESIMQITKAVIPAAGFGTRFLPLTKVVPKEMLPLLNKPAIQNIIEEGIDSHITDFFIVTRDEKSEIANHFKKAPKLEKILQEKNKLHLLKSIDTVIKKAHVEYINQPEPLGLGHAILMARDAIGPHYFGVFLPDDIIIGHIPALAQLITVAQKYNASVIGVQEVPIERISCYGVVATKKEIEPGVFEITRLVEKPKQEDAPSNLAIVGRYILSPNIFDAIEATKNTTPGEIQLTDAIDYLLKKGEKILACTIKGTRYDLGMPLGWLKANIHLGLNDPALAPHIKNMINQK